MEKKHSEKEKTSLDSPSPKLNKSGVMENGEIRIRPTIPDEWSCYRLEKIKCQEKELSIIYDKTGEKYHREKGFQVWCNGECIHKSLYPEEIKVAR